MTKLEDHPRSYAASRLSHPYISLPESYQGNQLTSYGGTIKYKLQPHTERYAYDSNVPDIILKVVIHLYKKIYTNGSQKAGPVSPVTRPISYV